MKVLGLINIIRNWIVFRRFHVQVGEDTLVGGVIFIKGRPGTIKIGCHTVINSDRIAVPLGYQPQTILWTIGNGSINIGSNCGITNSTICSASKITIEDYVTIGGGVKLFDTDFHSLEFDKRIDFVNDDDRKTKPIHIKQGAFIGAGSIILKGVTIGEKSIIGAGSVITKNVPDGEIWAGNPARRIKKIV